MTKKRNSQPLQSPLSVEEELAVRSRLLEFLAVRTERYTFGDSSSVPVETAQRLLSSICFCLGVGPDSSPECWRHLLTGDMESLFAQGIRQTEQKLAAGKRLWEAVCRHLPKAENRSMLDTLKSIGSFWKRYDIRFFAHEIPCDIDYQLFLPVPERLQGVDYVNLYLERLALENDFLLRFSPEAEISVLAGCCPDYRGLLINLFESVAVNALGLTLLGEDADLLGVSPESCRLLEKRFAAMTEPEAEEALCRAAKELAEHKNLREERQIAYLTECARQLAPRAAAVCRTGGMAGVFVQGQS